MSQLSKEQRKALNDEIKTLFKKPNPTHGGYDVNYIKNLGFKFDAKYLSKLRTDKLISIVNGLKHAINGSYNEKLTAAGCGWLVAPMKAAANAIFQAIDPASGTSNLASLICGQYTNGIPIVSFNEKCVATNTNEFFEILFSLYLQRYSSKKYAEVLKKQDGYTAPTVYKKNSDNQHSFVGKDLEPEKADEFFTSGKKRKGSKKRYLTTMFVTSEEGLKNILTYEVRVGIAPLVQFKIIPAILSGVRFALKDVYDDPNAVNFIGSFTFSKTKAKFSLKKSKPNPFEGEVPSITYLGNQSSAKRYMPEISFEPKEGQMAEENEEGQL